MNVGILIFLTILMTLMLAFVQRSEGRRRLIVIVVLLVPAELLRRYILYKGVETEGWVALVIALILNFLFWALIGRYNPVHKSDEIQVIGMDD